MRQVSSLFSVLLFAGILDAASLDMPVFTDSYYNPTFFNSTSGGLPSSVYRPGGINSNGVAVGVQFNDFAQTTYVGVIFSTTSYTRFALPFWLSGSYGTQVTGINSQGVVVGYDTSNPYVNNPSYVGFVGQPGALSTFSIPGAVSTMPYAINNAGVIVGGYFDASGIEHGFIRQSDGTFQTIDAPGRTNTVLHGINNSGQIVGSSGPIGSYLNTPGDGFLYSNGAFTNLFFGLPTSINDAGDISLANTYNNAAILYPDGTLSVIHLTDGSTPDYSDPFGVTGVNNAGEIVGISFGPSYAGVYLATPVPEPSSLLLMLTAAVGCFAMRRLRS